MPRWPPDSEAASAASRSAKRAVTNLFPAFIVLLLGVTEASPSSIGPTSSSQLRYFTSPHAHSDNIRVFPTLSSPGNPYLSSDSRDVKRSAQLFFSDRQRTNVKRSDILQSLDEQFIPWMIRGANPGLISTHEAIEAAFARTVFFGDFPHQRALESHLSMREEEGLPTLRLGSIRFTSPFLLPL